MKNFAIVLIVQLLILSAYSMPIYSVGNLNESSKEFMSKKSEDKFSVNLSSRRVPVIKTAHKNIVPWLGLVKSQGVSNRKQIINVRRMRAYRAIAVVVDVKFWKKPAGDMLLKITDTKGEQIAPIYKLTDKNLREAWRVIVSLEAKQRSQTFKIETIADEELGLGYAMIDQISVETY